MPRGVTSARACVIGSGWQMADRLFGAGDVDRDGKVDLVAREAGTGRMRTYFGTGTGSFGTMLRWGSGFQNLSTVIGGQDLTGDGIPDQLGVFRGQLLLYPGTGQREFSAAGQLGVDLRGTDNAFVVGDVNRDGYADVVARDIATGNLELWTDPGRSSAPTAPRVIGVGWSGMNLIGAAGDLTMDGVPDILARSASTGTLYVYPLTTTGGFKKSYVGRYRHGLDDRDTRGGTQRRRRCPGRDRSLGLGSAAALPGQRSGPSAPATGRAHQHVHRRAVRRQR